LCCPRAGSFELLIAIVALAGNMAQQIPPSIAANALYDLAKLVYRRATGQKDSPETSYVSELLRRVPGDIDAINDALDQDIVRIHRPFEGPVVKLNIYGGTNFFGSFDHQTYDFALARELGQRVEQFIGEVASFNSNTETGRLWLPAEQRTVAFRRDQSLKRLREGDRRLLSWSLDRYVNKNDGTVFLSGYALRNRGGKLKIIFVTRVETAREAA
jgi:hypothetical protein